MAFLFGIHCTQMCIRDSLWKELEKKIEPSPVKESYNYLKAIAQQERIDVYKRQAQISLAPVR